MAFLIIATSICVISTMSVSGIVILLFVFIMMGTIEHMNKHKYQTVVIFIILGVIIFLSINGTDFIDKNELINGMFFRIENNTNNTASMGGRDEKWRNVIDYALSWYNVFIGKGAVVGDHQIQYAPHSGHLYLLVSFGFISNLIFYKTFFWFKKDKILSKIIVVVPFFIAFSINTGLSDYRFMTIMALITGCLHNIDNKCKDTM